jgi:cytochrome b subunit of formate dehydrogenase
MVKAVAEKRAERFSALHARRRGIMHAVLFSTFLGLAARGCRCASARATGRASSPAAVGGFGAILFFHKLCALVLTVAFLIHVKDIVSARIVNREKGIFWGSTSMVANWKDVKDLFGHLRWFVGMGPKPQFGRYAYWEKFDYWAVFWGMIVIGFSGYAMWFAPFFARFLPGWALNAVLVVHSEEGLLAILFIFSIHFVNTHLRPDSFPMDMVIFTGVESEEEFKTQAAAGVCADGARRKAGEADRGEAGDVAIEFQQGDRVHGYLDRADSAGAHVDGLFQSPR